MSNLEVLVTAYLKKYNYGDIILLKYQSVSVLRKIINSYHLQFELFLRLYSNLFLPVDHFYLDSISVTI